MAFKFLFSDELSVIPLLINILINLSGRGDKDIDTIASLQGMKV